MPQLHAKFHQNWWSGFRVIVEQNTDGHSFIIFVIICDEPPFFKCGPVWECFTHFNWDIPFAKRPCQNETTFCLSRKLSWQLDPNGVEEWRFSWIFFRWVESSAETFWFMIQNSAMADQCMHPHHDTKIDGNSSGKIHLTHSFPMSYGTWIAPLWHIP